MARYRRGRSYRGKSRRRRYAKRGKRLRAGKIGFRM